MEPLIARALLDSLQSTLRQTDIVGWYRQDRVAGALLAESRNDSAGDASTAVRERLIDDLQTRLPPELVQQFRFRIHRYPDRSYTHMKAVTLTNGAVRETS